MLECVRMVKTHIFLPDWYGVGGGATVVDVAIKDAGDDFQGD